jgi:hypothetical protein
MLPATAGGVMVNVTLMRAPGSDERAGQAYDALIAALDAKRRAIQAVANAITEWGVGAAAARRRGSTSKRSP